MPKKKSKLEELTTDISCIVQQNIQQSVYHRVTVLILFRWRMFIDSYCDIASCHHHIATCIFLFVNLSWFILSPRTHAGKRRLYVNAICGIYFNTRLPSNSPRWLHLALIILSFILRVCGIILSSFHHRITHLYIIPAVWRLNKHYYSGRWYRRRTAQYSEYHPEMEHFAPARSGYNQTGAAAAGDDAIACITYCSS